MTTRAHERMLWLLRRLASPKNPPGFVVAWDQDLVDDFLEDFPESSATAKHYTLGPSSVPMLNRAARRAYDRGYLDAGHVGNQEARSHNQRTWCRCWSLTSRGRIVAADPAADAAFARGGDPIGAWYASMAREASR